MRIRTLCFLAALWFPWAAHASGEPLEINKVVSQQERIRADVMSGEAQFTDMPDRTRAQLLDKQGKLLKMLEGKETSNDLTPAEQVEAFNTLEWITAAINKNYDNRMVCVREKAIGSNRVTRSCRTAAQWEEARERARNDLETQGKQAILAN